jgi:hypothetical protein
MNLKTTSLILCLSFGLPIFASDKLPDWIVNPVLDEGKYGSVICSHEALDPEKAKQLAEDKCYLAAARSQGVSIKVNSRSTQTLTASEVSESVESLPVVKFVKCNWQNQFIERSNGSYRVWLKCQYSKEAPRTDQKFQPEEFKAPERAKTMGASSNSIIRLLMVPKAEVILIQNDTLPERVFRDIEQNMAIDIRKGDRSVIIKHHLYRDYVVDLSKLEDGEISTMTIYLEKEL